MDNLIKISAEAISALKKEGADKASCNVGSSVTHEFNVDGGKFSLFRTLFDKHLVMTAIKDGKKGSVRQNRYDDETVKELAKECLETASSSVADEAWDISELEENKSFEYGEATPDLDKLFMRCRELMDNIAERHPKVLMEQMIVTHKEVNTVYANTNGVLFPEHYGQYEVSLMFSAHDGELSSSFFGSGVITDSLDKPFIECGSVEKDLSDIEKQIVTKPLSEKFEGIMVLTPACLSEFLYYALGSFADGSSLLEGTSPWKDKLGQRVADERISISSSPLDNRIVCGERVTDDGYASENYDIIKNGVLSSFMLSQYVANKTGNKRSLNSANSMIMDNGEKSLDDIISSIKKGIIVGRFSGGQPSSNGDFSGVAKNSFLIEDGKITDALSETMISGNLEAMLNNVYEISENTVTDGMSVLPYASFDGITVSGK